MAPESFYSLAEVLEVAKIHPFYALGVKYPPDIDAVNAARERACQKSAESELTSLPVLWKRTLYSTISRLIDDTSPQNVFRHSVYASTTGGGSDGKPLFFATDVHENRRARADFGRFIRSMGLITNSDWVVTTHTAGELYRSLDLILEILENAGASVLAAGQHMHPAEVVQLMIKYHANALSGDSSQIVSVVRCISELPQGMRNNVRLKKIIYTSEALTPSQRAHILDVLPHVQVYSILGSAEAGPYAVSRSHLGTTHWATSTYQDFVFDTRMTRIEIFAQSSPEHDSHPKPVQGGERGIIAQTSLTRLRNPLVRYITGDVGSLHSLPEEMKGLVSESEESYLRILRLHGRDHRFSFEWDGEYLEFSGLHAMMNDVQSGVLQWQVILSKNGQSMEELLEFRILHSNDGRNIISRDKLVSQIETFFHVYPANRARFKLLFLEDSSLFKRSETGRKIINFINNYN